MNMDFMDFREIDWRASIMSIHWILVFFVFFSPSLVYFLCLMYRMRKVNDFCRWFKNLLNFSVFMTIFFPAAVTLFTPIFLEWCFSENTKLDFNHVAVFLVLLFILAPHAALEDIRRKPLEPFYYNEDFLLEYEMKLRREIKRLAKVIGVSQSAIVDKKRMKSYLKEEASQFYRSTDELSKLIELHDGHEKLKERLTTKKKCEADDWEEKSKRVQVDIENIWRDIDHYKVIVGGMESDSKTFKEAKTHLKEVKIAYDEKAMNRKRRDKPVANWPGDEPNGELPRLSWFAVPSVLINLFAATTIACMFWYFLVVDGDHMKKNAQVIAFVMALLYFWFPFRFYKEWYTNFYSVGLRRFYGFMFVLLAAVFSFILFYVKEDELILKGLSVSVIAILSIIGVVEKIKPEWYYDGIFPFIEETESHRVFAWSVLMLLAIAAIVLALIEAPEPEPGVLGEWLTRPWIDALR